MLHMFDIQNKQNLTYWMIQWKLKVGPVPEDRDYGKLDHSYKMSKSDQVSGLCEFSLKQIPSNSRVDDDHVVCFRDF